MAARKVVDSRARAAGTTRATNLGRIEPLAVDRRASRPRAGVVLPLVELRVDFALSRAELADLERGAEDIDLEPWKITARRIAVAENRAVFHGWETAGIRGIAEHASHDAVALYSDFNAYSAHAAEAVETLLRNGIMGPYAWRWGRTRTRVSIQTAEHGGVLLFDHVKKILQGGPIVWAPGVARRGRGLPARRRLPVRVRPGLSIGYSPPRRGVRVPVPRGELLVPRGDAGGRLRSHPPS